MTSRISPTAALLALLLVTPLHADPELTGLDYPYAGVSLIGPPGWFGRLTTCKFVVARWELPGIDPSTVQGAIEVRALPGNEVTLQQFADLLGTQFNAQIVDKSMTIDGVPAWRLEVAHPTENFAIRGLIVAEHDGLLYAILDRALVDQPWLPAVRQVMDKWKWIPVNPPDQHLRYNEMLSTLLRGVINVRLPVGMGTTQPNDDWTKPADSVTLSLVNFKKGTDEFTLIATLQDRRADETIDAFRDHLLGLLQPRTKEPLAWGNVPEWDGRRMTKPVKVAEGIYEQYACVEVDHTHVAVLTFRTAADSDEDRAFYQHQTEFMIRDMIIRPPTIIRPLTNI